MTVIGDNEGLESSSTYITYPDRASGKFEQPLGRNGWTVEGLNSGAGCIRLLRSGASLVDMDKGDAECEQRLLCLLLLLS